MALSAVAGTETGGENPYSGKVTVYVLLTCLIATASGLILGYDIGISGGVTSMESFLLKFFPSVYRKMQAAANQSDNQYCIFNSQLLTTFTSSLYLAALISSFFAAKVTRVLGRRNSMFAGGITFLAGSLINGAAENISMLIIGRILLGIGVGFACQSAPIYLSEMAPANRRGMINMCFQLMITIGIFVANLINYGTSKIKGDWSWRISLGLAAVPAMIITVGSFFLPDTPNSLVARGHNEKAMAMLRKIRGTDDVEKEFKDLVAATDESKNIQHPWSNIIKRKYRPQLVMSILLPSLQQLTGINVIMFYAPVLFKTIGFGNDAALMSAVITGLVNMVSTLVSIATVDKFGRRILYMEGGPQMFICQVVVGVLIQIKFGSTGEGHISKNYAQTIIAFICLYVAGFAWSWGPLTSLVPSEIYPIEIRTAAQSVTISVSMLFTFFIAQAFLPMLCHLKFGLFYFFAGWVFVMTVYVYIFLPETKNIPIERVVYVWRHHWFWSRFVEDAEDDDDHAIKKLENANV